jgi:Rrf2 family cysteine metabolism transcriptional repressor
MALKISTKFRYGLRLMIELGKEYGSGPVSIKEIARRMGVSYEYLKRIALSLEKHGLLTSKRGQLGGFELSRHPDEINVYTIFLSFIDELALTDCLVSEDYCSLARRCAARELWHEINEQLKKMLKSKSLSDLVARQIELDSKMNFKSPQ